MVVVMPAGHVPGKAPAMGAGPDQDPFAKDLLSDIIPYVEKHYHVSAKREHRALAGLSMGGIQVMNIALFNPDKFNYVLPLSTGYFPPVLEELEKKYTTVLKNPKINQWKLFWIAMGGEKDIAYQNNKNTMALFDKYGIKYQYTEVPGGHTFLAWRNNLHTFAPLLFR
jgi:enterochelin esterase family protein